MSFVCFVRNMFGDNSQPFTHLLGLLRTKINRRPNIHKDTKVLLYNHVSWADFMIDNYITHCKSTYISRMMVIIAIPCSSLFCLISKTIYFINLNTYIDTEKIIDCINNKYEKIVLLYPEGTRNRTNGVISLKKGFLLTIYKKDIQTQIVFVSNKEKVLDEKKMKLGFNVECNVYNSPPIIPSTFSSFDLFYEYISNEWLTYQTMITAKTT